MAQVRYMKHIVRTKAIEKVMLHQNQFETKVHRHKYFGKPSSIICATNEYPMNKHAVGMN